jgi:hypothetical protein
MLRIKVDIMSAPTDPRPERAVTELQARVAWDYADTKASNAQGGRKWETIHCGRAEGGERIVEGLQRSGSAPVQPRTAAQAQAAAAHSRALRLEPAKEGRPSTAGAMADFFIRRPIVAMVIAILTVIVGVITLKGLPISEYPPVSPTMIQVTTTYRGAAAEAVMESVATPIESKVNGVDKLLYMQSYNANDGKLTLNVL